MNSFIIKKRNHGLSKKIICIIMTICLSVMMLPSALFKTQAHATEPAKTEDVFVKADNDMTNFGQFAFNPNSNAANVSVYTQNDLLHAIGCKAESEESIIEKANAQIKKSLTDNLHSVVNDNLPAAKDGWKATLTSVENVKSNLPCLTVSKVPNTNNWQFTTSAPTSNNQSGALEITSKYAHYTAEYAVELNGQPITQEKEIKVDAKNYASGKITISPIANKTYKLIVDLDIINLPKLISLYAVSVYKNNDYVLQQNSNNFLVEDEVVVDLSSIVGKQDMRDVPAMKKQLVKVVNAYEEPFKIGDTDTYIRVNPEYEDNILTDKAYTVSWDSIKNVVIQTKVNSKDVFQLCTDKEKKVVYDDDYTFKFTTSIFDINAPEDITKTEEKSKALSFFDNKTSTDKPIDPDLGYDNAFQSDDISLLGNFGDGYKYVVMDNNSKVKSFKEKIDKLVLQSTDVKQEKKVQILLCDSKSTDENCIIKKVDQLCVIQLDDYFIKFEVITQSTSPNPIEFLMNGLKVFFAGNENGKVILRFKYVNNKMTRSFDTADIIKDEKTIFSDLKPVVGEKENIVYFDAEINATDSDAIIKNLEGAIIQPYHFDIFHWKWPKKSCQINRDPNSPQEIVANAPAPESVAITWGKNKPTDDEQAKKTTENYYFKDALELTVTLNMPKDQGEIFKYTKAYKSKHQEGDVTFEDEPLVTLNVDNGTSQPVLFYKDLKNEGESNNEWKDSWIAEYTIDIGDNDFYKEHHYTLHINKVEDILGRTCKGGTDGSDHNYYFSIDKQAPVFEILFEGPSPSNTYDGVDFYNENGRKAKVVVHELNFDGSLIEIIRNLDGKDEKIILPTESWNNDDSRFHYTYIEFPSEGEYCISVAGSDLTAWIGEPFQTEKFIQDWTTPTISVSWDNNNVVNEKYYTAGRTATFVMEERNFASEYINVSPIVSAGNDGTMGTTNFSGWSPSGNNLWCCTVSFPSEGTYALTMDGTDKALNSMSPYSQSEFVIDWTKPNIQINGVENRQAYGDTAQPSVVINDANMSTETTCNVESLGATKAHPYSASPATTPSQFNYDYSNPEKVAENDGVYRIEVNAVDMAGNADTQSLVWSVNRFGSTYVIDADTETIMNGYVNDKSKKDIKLIEINPSGLENSSIDMTKGSFSETLKKGEDYTADETGGGESWYECTYTIPKDRFKEDGKYTLNYYSTDKVGNANENTMQKNADRTAAVNVQFVLDNAKPSCSFDNLSEDQYGDVTHKATAKFEDNTNKFTEAKVIINGDEKWVSGDDLEKGGNKVDFELHESNTPYTVETVATDKAGNTMDKMSKTVLVTSNPFVRWFYNTPLFIGSLVGIGVLIAVIAYLIYRKKQNQNK